MFRLFGRTLVLATLLSFALTLQAPAENKAPALTKIWVTDMHCESCAKRIRSQLYAVSGVVKVVTNVKADVAVVVPQRNKQPSPLRMWQAVQQAGFVVVKLEGPSGVFTRENPPR